MTRIIILCAGQANRWAPKSLKQLVPIDGEPLLHRTVRLLRSFEYDDIYIACIDPKLRIEGCKHFTPSDARWTASTLYSSRHLWDNRTIILLGDVYYTEESLTKILECPSELKFIGRLGPSSFTGCPYGEIFGLLFSDSMHLQLENILKTIIEKAEHLHRDTLMRYVAFAFSYVKRFLSSLQKQKKGNVFKRMGMAHNCANLHIQHTMLLCGRLWNLYCKCTGLPLDKRTTQTPMFMNIDDFTEDFDTLDGYTTWIAKFAQYHAHNIPDHSMSTSPVSP